jgi:hypothetical protein
MASHPELTTTKRDTEWNDILAVTGRARGKRVVRWCGEGRNEDVSSPEVEAGL